MEAVIFCGGFGTRLSEYTLDTPKPLVHIGQKPIVLELLETLNKNGVENFYLALGYKANKFKSYFRDLHENNSNFSINFSTGKLSYFDRFERNWTINLIDTGLNTMTGGRLKRISEYVKSDDFLVTYGDGLANVDCNSLMEDHLRSGNEVTITAVRPDARFGRLQISGTQVTEFTEKERLNEGWINGGFMMVNKRFIKRIAGDETVLEEYPLVSCAQEGKLGARMREGFWQCMDTKRDHEMLNNLATNNTF